MGLIKRGRLVQVLLFVSLVLGGIFFLTLYSAGGVTGAIVSTAENSMGTQDLGVQNIPSITLILNTTNLASNDTEVNLTAYNTTQVNGTNLGVIYNWLRNDAPIAWLNMPFEGGSLDGNNTGSPNMTRDYARNISGSVVNATWNATGGHDGRGAYEFHGRDMIMTGLGTYSGEIYPTLPNLSTVTFTAWVNPEHDSSDQVIVGTTGSGIAFVWIIDYPTNRTSLHMGGSADGTDACLNLGTTGIPANNWTHMAVSWDNITGCKAYVDGIFVGNRTTTIGGVQWGLNGNNFIFGARRSTTPHSFGDAFNGTIDDVVIFNRSLSAEQIFALAQNKTNIIVANETSLGENWTVEATPNNGTANLTGDGVTVTSNNVTIIDSTAPTVTITYPANGSNFSRASSNFNATVSDSESNISSVIFMFNTNATPFNKTAVNASGIWGTVVNLSDFPEGLHPAIAFANDTYNNVNQTVNISFTIDRTPPNVSLNHVENPSDNSNFSISSSNKTFNVSIFDNITQVDSVYFWFDNGTGTDFNITATNRSGQWTVNYNVSTLAEEKQGIRVMVNDTVNNVNDSHVINFTVDFTRPTARASCSPSSASVGTTVVCTCSATDSLSGVRSATFSQGRTSLSFTELIAAAYDTELCTATDYSGNIKSERGLFTMTSVGGSSSGGSGGSGSSGSRGNFKKTTWATLEPGETATVKVADEKIGVREVEITVNDLVKGLWIEVRRDGVPENIQVKFKRKVYKDIEIKAAPTLTYDALEDAKVTFTVEKEWLAENNLPKENIALFRYIELLLPEKVHAWAELPTDVKKEEKEIVEYSAQTPGFSYFLIGEKTPENKTVEIITENVSQKYVPAELEIEPLPTVSLKQRIINFVNVNYNLVKNNNVIRYSIYAVIFVLVVVVALYLILKKPKRKKKKK